MGEIDRKGSGPHRGTKTGIQVGTDHKAGALHSARKDEDKHQRRDDTGAES